MEYFLLIGFFPVIFSFLVCGGLILFLKPLLYRYALSWPSDRGLHKKPTPQGGGIAIMGTILSISFFFCEADLLPCFQKEWFGRNISPEIILMGSALALCFLGALDDRFSLSPLFRLSVQLLLVTFVIYSLPPEGRLLPNMIPLFLERGALIFGTLWFINLTNFMDGLDLMTVSCQIPFTLFFVALWFFHLTTLFDAPMLENLPPLLQPMLLGALLSFAFFNWPPARLFLGDSGSLPLGLLMAYSLIILASHGHLVAALLLPLYSVADATLTLSKRIWRRAKLSEAHKEHFYQQAYDKGFSVLQIVGSVFLLNVLLATLAFASIVYKAGNLSLGYLFLGIALTFGILRYFARRPSLFPDSFH